MASEEIRKRDVMLCHRVAKGDSAALTELYNNYKRLISRWQAKMRRSVMHKNLSLTDLEIKQNALLAVYDATKRYDPTKSSFATWLRYYLAGRMTKSFAEFTGANSPRGDNIEEKFALSDTQQDIYFERAVVNVDLQKVLAIIDEMLPAICTSEKQRSIFNELLHGKTPKELAGKYGMTHQGIHSHYSTVAIKLRQKLKYQPKERAIVMGFFKEG